MCSDRWRHIGGGAAFFKMWIMTSGICFPSLARPLSLLTCRVCDTIKDLLTLLTAQAKGAVSWKICRKECLWRSVMQDIMLRHEMLQSVWIDRPDSSVLFH